MLKALHHTGFVVEDIDAAIRFYQETLGLEVLARYERVGAPISQVIGYEDTHLEAVTMWTGSGHILELIRYVNPAARRRPTEERSVVGGTHLAFQVDDVESVLQRMVENGARPVNPPVEVAPGRKICYLQDPEGNWLELLELSE